MRASNPLLICTAFILAACGVRTIPILPTIPPPEGSTSTSPHPTLTAGELPGPWKLVSAHNVHHNVMAAGFLSQDFGITVGVYPGNPYYTTDGGLTWMPGDMLADCRYGMDVVSAQVAWACGGMTHVRRSIDGGRTWQAVTDFGQGTTRPCHTISFLDDATGWLATLYLFGSTEDGGATWSMVPQPQGIAKIASIDLVAPGRGYVLDFSGALFATQDNGAQWTFVSRLDLGGLTIPEAAYQMAAMRFSQDGAGLIVISEQYRRGRVLAFHTTDGGKTWTSELVPVTSGPVFLSRLEPLLTVLNGPGMMSVLRYSGK